MQPPLEEIELLGCTLRLAVHELFRCPGRLDLDSSIAAHGPDRKRGRTVVISRHILPAEGHYEPG
jgi:hypothetical protein